jgi:AcrR family transcriptional regulator
MSASRTSRPSLRSDAARNRDRIVGAAREAFCEQGLGVPMQEIAARAGVGRGTLYRHFSTREALVDASFKGKIDEYLNVAEAAAETDDAWAAFSGFVERICEMQAEDPGFSDVMTTIFPAAKGLEDERSRAYKAMKTLVRRAHEQGTLRPDVTAEDLAYVFWANAAFLAATREIAPRTWRRYAALLLHAFRSDNAAPLPEPPLTERQLLRVTGRRRRRARRAERR